MDTKNWQATLRTIRGRNKFMYNNKLHSDVEFSVVNSVGAIVIIPAHKYVLSISSPVFEAMFCGNLAAKLSRTICLPDCPAEGLLELFRYMYYDEVHLTLENVLDVKYLAERCMVPLLAQRCTQFVNEHLEVKQALRILSRAVKVGDTEVQEICWDVIDQFTESALTNGESFLDVTQETLRDILSRDTLSISELKLFQAVIRWADKKMCECQGDRQASRRSVLSERVINLIRFPLLKPEEFVINAITSNILNMSEILEVASFYSSLDKSTLKTFNAEKRNNTTKILRKVNCHRFQAERFFLRKFGQEAITFVVDQEVWLEAVGFYCEEQSKCAVNLSVYKEDQLVVQLNQEFHTGVRNTRYTGFVVALERAVCVEPYRNYTLRATFDKDVNTWFYSGEQGRAMVEYDHVKIEFKNPPCVSDYTSAEHGQFPHLLFHQVLKSKKRGASTDCKAGIKRR